MWRPPRFGGGAAKQCGLATDRALALHCQLPQVLRHARAAPKEAPMYYLVVRQFAATLRNLDKILSKAESYAKARGFDVNNFVNARLAPDMLPLVVQIRIACDSAKFAAAGLSGKEAPRHQDEEKTFEDLHGRIGKVLSFLDGFTEADFAKTSPDLKIKIPGPSGKALRANDFLLGRQVPNFNFHVVTAYNILRHGGVDIGKRDYLGELPVVDP
jgi:hypothetical protein